MKDQAERDALESHVARMNQPADPAFVMVRIAALLSPYYGSDVPHSVRKIDAEDWSEALDGFPAWAIVNACRWWKSDKNKDRRKKPLEGDIRARCKIEVAALLVAERAISRFDGGVAPFQPPPGPPDRPTQEQAAEILAAANFHPKRGFSSGE